MSNATTFESSTEAVVIRLLAAQIDSPLGHAVRSVKTFDDYIKYVSEIECAPGAVPFGKDYLLSCFLKKWEGGGSEESRISSTFVSWIEAEQQCARTNFGLNRIHLFPEVVRILDKAREYVALVLGQAATRRVFGLGRWSGGATYATRRGVHATLKMVGVKSVTPLGVLPLRYFFEGFGEAPLNEFEVVEGNKCVQVPKSWKINRMIAAEPAANAFMQQAVGQFIRSRLLSVAGIDLTDQTTNQLGAFRALVDGLATIDLSMASDTLATALVDLLLPPEWFRLLNELRSPKSRWDDRWYLLNKFSSMGNAFTFELETLIFWSLCKALGESDPLVYGDDIVVSSALFEPLSSLLNVCGFNVNQEKSFGAESRFFESCGKHYYDLEDVTPAYQKEVIRDDHSILRCYNRLVRWAQRTDGYDVVKPALRFLRSKASESARKCRIPFCQRDDGFISHPSLLKTNANGDFVCKTLSPSKPVYLVGDRHVDQYAGYRLRLSGAAGLNEHPRGYLASVRVMPRSVVRRSVIWRSSLTNEN